MAIRFCQLGTFLFYNRITATFQWNGMCHAEWLSTTILHYSWRSKARWLRWCPTVLKTWFSVLYQHLLVVFLLLAQCLLLFHRPVKLPDRQGSMSPHKGLFFPVSHSEDPYYGPDLPVSAIAGLVGDEAETFTVDTDFFPFYYSKSLCFLCK